MLLLCFWRGTWAEKNKKRYAEFEHWWEQFFVQKKYIYSCFLLCNNSFIIDWSLSSGSCSCPMRSIGVDRSLRNLTGDWLRRVEGQFVVLVVWGGNHHFCSCTPCLTIPFHLSSLSSRLTLWRWGSYLLLKILCFSCHLTQGWTETCPLHPHSWCAFWVWFKVSLYFKSFFLTCIICWFV